MKKSVLFLLVIRYCYLLLGQVQQENIVYVNEFFQDNKRSWIQLNTPNEKVTIEKNHGLIWEKKIPEPKFIWQKFNIDFNQNFEISCQITDSSNSSFGLVWAGLDAQNAQVLLIENDKIFYIELSNGKTAKTLLKSNVSRQKSNLFNIIQFNGESHFLINTEKIFSTQSKLSKGYKVGFASFSLSKLSVQSLVLKAPKANINLSDSLVFEQAQSLPSAINTAFDETAPVIAPNNILYFSRRGDVNNIAGAADDIYVSRKNNNDWTQANNVGSPLNNAGHNYVCSIVQNLNKLLVANTYNNLSGSTMSQGVSISQLEGNTWAMPIALPIRNFYSDKSNNDFSLSADGKILLMALDRKDGKGKNDLYFSTNGNTGWSEPVNLGAVLNTSEDEFSPFLSADLKTLYFASRGHAGFGEADIFMSQRLDHTWLNWSKPINLGTSINSEFFDGYFNFLPNDSIAYFVSQSESGHDIFTTKLPSCLIKSVYTTFEAQALDKSLNKKIEHFNIEFFPELNNVQSFQKIDFNKYQINLNDNSRMLRFKISAVGYTSLVDSLLIDSESMFKTISRVYELKTLVTTKHIVLKNILFERGDIQVSKKSYSELDKLYKVLLLNPSLKIQIRGHTDNQGNPELNQKLSQSRADNIKAYLTAKGIDESRIQSLGLGGSQPISNNNSESSRKLNRRVEIIELP